LDKLAVARIVEHALQAVYRVNHAREVHLPIVSLKYVYKGYEFSVFQINVYSLMCRSKALIGFLDTGGSASEILFLREYALY